MRLFKSALVVAALAFAAPVWAHGGHGKHHGGDNHRHGSHWRDQQHHRHHGHHRQHHRHYYSQYYSQPYYAPYPVYAAPAPGVHIVVPNIYIPLR